MTTSAPSGERDLGRARGAARAQEQRRGGERREVHERQLERLARRPARSAPTTRSARSTPRAPRGRAAPRGPARCAGAPARGRRARSGRGPPTRRSRPPAGPAGRTRRLEREHGRTGQQHRGERSDGAASHRGDSLDPPSAAPACVAARSPLGLALLALALGLAQRPGTVVADTKVDLYVDPGALPPARAVACGRRRATSGTSSARSTAATRSRWRRSSPLGDALGLPVWLVHRLWLGAVLALAA